MDTNTVKNTLDQIPNAKPNAKRIVGLVKEKGKVTGYKLSDQNIVTKADAPQVNPAITGFTIIPFTSGFTPEYLTSIKIFITQI